MTMELELPGDSGTKGTSEGTDVIAASDLSRSFEIDNPFAVDSGGRAGDSVAQRGWTSRANSSSSPRSSYSNSSMRRSTRRKSIITKIRFPSPSPSGRLARVCPCAKRVCCNSLVAPDDLILREERDQLKEHLQPSEFAMEDDTCDQLAEILVEVFLGLGGWKIPVWTRVFICDRCNKSQNSLPSYCSTKVIPILYRVYQIALIGLLCFSLVVPAFTELFCTVDLFPHFAPSLPFTCLAPFSCPQVQDSVSAFFNANITATASSENNNNSYRGMRATMKALSSSELVAGGRYFGAPKPFSDVFASVNTTSELDPKLVNDYLEWRAETGSLAPHALYSIFWCSVVLCLISSFMVFSVKFQPLDPVELLFPALLEVNQDVDTLRTQSFGDGASLSSFHFVRPRRLALHTLVCGGVAITIAGCFLPSIPPILFLFFPGVGIATFVMPMGLAVQVHNVTMLSNILARYCSPMGSFEQFEKWKAYYKTTVGALHVWSWRMTPITSSVSLVFLSGITRFVVELVFLWTTVMGEPDIPPRERFRVFRDAANAHVVLLIGFTLMLLVFTAAMGSVHGRFKQLHVLLATVRLEAHGGHDRILEDLSILQENKAALTVFDTPVKTGALILLYRLLFVEVALIAVSATGLL